METEMRTSELLPLLHLTSSSFPTGGFSHSMGLESMLENGWLKNEADFEILCRDTLLRNLGKTDAPSVRLACTADLDSLLRLDKQVTALKPTKELREAGLKMGRAFIRVFSKMYPEPPLNVYWEKITAGGGGNYPVVFGAACGRLKIAPYNAALAYLFAALSNFMQTAIKLLPLSQITAQQLIVRLYPALEEQAELSAAVTASEMGGFAPQLDIASMNHEQLYSRSYMS